MRPEWAKIWPELVWLAFVAANLVAMVLLPDQVPVPFHFIWISLSLLYGVRAWRLGTTMLALIGVMVASGAALAYAIAREHADPDEYPEIVLMALVFLAMVLHVRRRQAATQEVNRLAEEQSRLLDRDHEFLRDASHQLRTPITVARGHAELLAADGRELAAASGVEGTSLQADADVVIEELDRLTRVSDGLLLLAAAERPEFLQRDPVRADDLVRELVGRWRSVAHRRWIVEAQPGTLLFGDRQRLRLALDALMENAVAFTHSGDEIVVRAARQGNDALLEVLDSGAGLSQSIEGRAFERFASDDSRRVSGRGTGLGLAGVRAVVTAHGGSVAAENRPTGGARIRLWLPALPAIPIQRADSDLPSQCSTEHRSGAATAR